MNFTPMIHCRPASFLLRISTAQRSKTVCKYCYLIFLYVLNYSIFALIF